MTSRRIVFSALAALLTATGCGQGSVADERPGGSTHAEPDFVRLDVKADEAFFPDAEVSGELLVQNGCLLLGSAVPAFTADFNWDPSREVLTWPEGELAVGSVGRFGGGQEPDDAAEESQYLTDEQSAIIDDCLDQTDAEFWSYITP